MTIAVDADTAGETLRRIEQRLRTIARAGPGPVVGETRPSELVDDVPAVLGAAPGHVGLAGHGSADAETLTTGELFTDVDGGGRRRSCIPAADDEHDPTAPRARAEPEA